MSINFKKFFISLFNSNKRSSKYNTRLKKLIEENKNIINQYNSNKDMLEIVIPGHYCSNDTLNSKVKDIIRIVGPDRHRQGYWITQDGKSMSEALILDSYTLLDTAAGSGKSFEKGKVTRKKHRDIMKGFKPIKSQDQQDEDDEDETNEIKPPYKQEIPDYLKPDYVKNENLTQNNKSKPIEKPKDPLDETKKLLEKATIEQLNINYEKKYGLKPYKPEIITIPLQIEIPYHLEKLNQICEIFELDTKTVAQIIFENLKLPEETILHILNNKLTSKVQENISDNTINMVVPKIRSIQEPQEQVQNNEELNKGISDIDNYLTSMFSGK